MPEILDHLPPDDPRAIRSRRDLALINTVMGQDRIMAKALGGLPAPGLIADLGGGDGNFMLAVARRLHWRDVKLLILDRQDIVSPATRARFGALGWSCEVAQGDIFQTLPQLTPDIVTANLFLHHFEDQALRRLLALAASRSKAFIACEPRRSWFSLLGAHLVFALGANAVTRHDAVASVRAGFGGDELSASWPPGWLLEEGGLFPFTHLFAARHGA